MWCLGTEAFTYEIKNQEHETEMRAQESWIKQNQASHEELGFKFSEVEKFWGIMDPWQLKETRHISQDFFNYEQQELNSTSSKKKTTVLVICGYVTTPKAQ